MLLLKRSNRHLLFLPVPHLPGPSKEILIELYGAAWLHKEATLGEGGRRLLLKCKGKQILKNQAVIQQHCAKVRRASIWLWLHPQNVKLFCGHDPNILFLFGSIIKTAFNMLGFASGWAFEEKVCIHTGSGKARVCTALYYTKRVWPQWKGLNVTVSSLWWDSSLPLSIPAQTQDISCVKAMRQLVLWLCTTELLIKCELCKWGKRMTSKRER